MFGNKKSNIPPRPHPPAAEQILEDISNADKDDAVFQFVQKGEIQDENLHHPMNINDTEAVYNKIQSYLKTKDRLKDLDETLKLAHESLQGSDVEMQRLAEDIKRQAQEALVSR